MNDTILPKITNKISPPKAKRAGLTDLKVFSGNGSLFGGKLKKPFYANKIAKLKKQVLFREKRRYKQSLFF
jgi:hypothetical protein